MQQFLGKFNPFFEKNEKKVAYYAIHMYNYKLFGGYILLRKQKWKEKKKT